MKGGDKRKVSEIIKLSEVDAFTNKEIYVGDQIQVFLEANPSTGYMWKVIFIDEKILEQVEAEKFIDQGSKIGSKGSIIYKFNVLKAGCTKLQLEYSRAWQKSEKDRDFIIEFKIKDKK